MEKENKHKSDSSKIKWIFRIMPVFAVLIIGITIWCNRDFLTIENLLKISPSGNMQSGFFMLVLYCAKSISVVLPINILYVLGSRLFSKWWALTINTAGLSCGLLLQYMIGKISGSEIIYYLCKRYTKMDRIIKFQDKNSFLSVFIIRLIGMLPMDVISMYYGACRCNIFVFLFASILGMLPNMVLYTLLGISLSQPNFKMFGIVIAIKVILIICTLAVQWYFKKKEGDNI